MGEAQSRHLGSNTSSNICGTAKYGDKKEARRKEKKKKKCYARMIIVTELRWITEQVATFHY